MGVPGIAFLYVRRELIDGQPTLGYECTTHVPTTAATHVVLTRRQ